MMIYIYIKIGITLKFLALLIQKYVCKYAWVTTLKNV